MKGIELVRETLALRETERPPWVPFVGVHGAYLLKETARNYLNSPELLVTGISKAVEEYDPDGLPVVFDLQIEAEALGCKLEWSDHNPPAVISHPLAENIILEDLRIPEKQNGRIGIVMKASREIKNNHPDLALYGLVTGPFTLGLHLLGTDIFIRMLEEPDYVKALLNFTAQAGMTMADYYLEAGCDVIAIVDPMTSQIDTDSFRNFITKPAKEIFNHIRKKDAFSSFFVCGHAQHNIEAMCECQPDNISIDENIPLEYVKDIALGNKISFGGNMKLTVVLLMGTEEDAQREALDCIDIGGKKGFILSPGCDLPMATPPRNIRAITELIKDVYKQDVIRTIEHTGEAIDRLNMKDYGQSDKVIVDIITLDSESCAPCQYMVEAVRKVVPHFEGIVEWREHAIKKIDSVTFMSSLMVKNIPTICIDGKIAFVSQIPPKHELIAAIQKRINEKLKLKIRSKQGEMLLLCKEKSECTDLKSKLQIAIKELGKDIKIKISTDPNLIASYGITQTPALVAVNYRVKSQGESPSLEVMKEWIKEI